MRLHLNLARHPADNRRREWILWGGALALLSLVLVVLGVTGYVGWRRTRAIKLQTAAVRRQLTPLLAGDRGLARQLNDPAIKATLAQADYFNQLLDRKSVSWTRLFERLEDTMPDQVELVSLKPMERGGASAVDLIFATDSFPAGDEFVSRLESAPDFADVQVLRDSNRVPTPGRGGAEARGPQWQFEVTVAYKPGAAATADDEDQP